MIRFILAIQPEAEPLIRHYRMERVVGAFPVYRSESAALVVSGVGKLAAAAATAYLCAHTNEESLGVFLNVGIAGHRTRPRGDALLAHTVTDAETRERFYPTLLPGLSLDALEVRTVGRPETSFDSDAVYEMEASGFYPTALRFSTTELVQCIKIVSDNREQPATKLSPEAVRKLVGDRIDTIAEAAGHFQRLASELDPVRREPASCADVESYRRRWRFTTTQSRMLSRLLTRWNALDPGGERSLEELEGARCASDVIDRIEAKLRSLFRERPL